MARSTVLIAIILLGATALARAQDAGPVGALDQLTAEVGGPAPDFRLQDLEMNWVQLSDLRGTPVVLNFFASWCGPCEIEMPYIQAAHEAASDGGYIVLGVAVQDSRGAIGHRHHARLDRTVAPINCCCKGFDRPGR